MIQFQNVSKNYTKQTVIENVSLTIEKGKLTVFIGPNGAGKSTLLNMMGRLIPYDHVEIIVEGKEIRKWQQNEFAKKVAILKQTNTMNAQITVRELLAFGRFPHVKGRIGPKCQELIRNALNYLGIEDLEYTYLSDLSGGQLQRTLIGMVLCQDAEYILLDEPLNNLDMKYALQIMKILRNLVDDLGRTVVIVIHDINFASAYADNIIALKDGKKFGDASAEQMMRKPIIDNLYDMDVEIIDYKNRKYYLYYAENNDELTYNETNFNNKKNLVSNF